MNDIAVEHQVENARRASPRAVVEARAAISLVKPYLSRMTAWQLEAAHLRAKHLARQSSLAEKQAAAERLAQLREAAEAALVELVAKVPDGHGHSRIDDTKRALERFANMVTS